MAQRHVDIDHNTDLSGITDAANAETLTNQVRVVYDNTTPKDELIDAIQRAKEAITEILASV